MMTKQQQEPASAPGVTHSVVDDGLREIGTTSIDLDVADPQAARTRLEALARNWGKQSRTQRLQELANHFLDNADPAFSKRAKKLKSSLDILELARDRGDTGLAISCALDAGVIAGELSALCSKPTKHGRKLKSAPMNARANRAVTQADAHAALVRDYNAQVLTNTKHLSHRRLCEAVASTHETSWRTVDRAVRARKK